MDHSFLPTPRLYFEVEKVIGMSHDGSYRIQWAPAWVSKYQLTGKLLHYLKTWLFVCSKILFKFTLKPSALGFTVFRKSTTKKIILK